MILKYSNHISIIYMYLYHCAHMYIILLWLLYFNIMYYYGVTQIIASFIAVIGDADLCLGRI